MDFCTFRISCNVGHPEEKMWRCDVWGPGGRRLQNSRRQRPQRQCPQSFLYRRCGVDTELPYRLFSWVRICTDQTIEAEFSVQVLGIHVASGVNTEFPYRVRIVDRGLIASRPCLPTPSPILRCLDLQEAAWVSISLHKYRTFCPCPHPALFAKSMILLCSPGLFSK